MSAGNPAPRPLDDALLDLVAEALERLEREGQGGLDALCAEHPVRATALREQVERLRDLGLADAPTGHAPPERLGAFRLLSHLGGGGMGVVYLAEQEGLGRQVALKLVRPEHLYFPGARERFRREVEALARLQHPGIVPVYAGGEERGIPYLAMELVRGATLEQALAELAGRDPARLTGADLHEAVRAAVARREHAGDAATVRTGVGSRLFSGSWTTACVRLASEVAVALDHAHGHGVLHRDVKPSNIMLTPDGRVLLLDFGLASAEGSVRLTGTGQPLGSPAYMSPEQLRGAAALDARTDVYSLGLSLYEALTLHQPFATESLEGTRLAVLAARPPAPRELNPAVTRDAETVLITAMEPERTRRYASAGALAADLVNVLELRPVQARRAGALLHARRWAQRHPARAVALVASALLLVGGPLAWAVASQRAADRIQLALDEANLARASAAANFDRARRAVDELLTQVSEEQLLDVPHLEPLRRSLLESALRYYDEFLAERGDDPALRFDAASAGTRAASLLGELGRLDEALAAAERAETLLAALLATAPQDPALLDLLGDAQESQALALVQSGRTEEAVRAADAAVASRRQRLALEPHSFAAHLDLDGSLGLVATAASRDGRMDVAAATYAELAEFDEQLMGRFPDEPGSDLRALGNLVVALGNRGDALHELGRPDESREVLERAVALSEPRLAELAASTASGLGAAAARLGLGRLLGNDGDLPGAERAMRSGLEVLASTEAAAPANVEVRRLLSTAWNTLGVLLMRAPGRGDEARAALQLSVDMLRRLVRESPATTSYALNLAGSLINTAALLRDGGDAAAARPLLEEALSVSEEVMSRDGGSADAREAAFYAAWHLALACLDQGDGAAAGSAALRLVVARPDEARPARIAAGLLSRAADTRERVAPSASGRDARVDALLEQSLDVLRAALAAGYDDWVNLDGSSDLARLRGEPAFAVLRAEVQARADVGSPEHDP